MQLFAAGGANVKLVEPSLALSPTLVQAFARATWYVARSGMTWWACSFR